MKKKLILLGVPVLAAAFGIVLYFSLFYGGDVRHVKTSVESLNSHSDDDVEECMEIVKKTFRADYKGCVLTDLWYDGDECGEEINWKKQYGGKEAIVLLSNFYVDDNTDVPCFGPDTTCPGWSWILVKNQKDKWKLETWGY